jgi:hypothetical protein
MPTTIFDSSLVTKRTQSKTIAKSFLQRLNTQGTVNQTTSYGPLLGIYDDSIVNEVKNGTIKYITKTEGGEVKVNEGCCPEPIFQAPGELGNFFIFLNCVVVNWSPPTNFGKTGPLTYYITATSSNGGQTVNGQTTANSYSFTNLTPLTNYTFTVTATNGSGSSTSVPSISIYAPPLSSESFANNLVISQNYAWAGSFFSSNSRYTFVKQRSDNYKCFGTTNTINLQYPASQLIPGPIFPLTDLIAYIALPSAVASDQGIGIYKTIDGGLSWSSITEGKIFTLTTSFPNYSYWWNVNEGIAAGDHDISSLANSLDIYYTEDGGENWIESSVTYTNGTPAGPIFGTISSSTYCNIGDTLWITAGEFNTPRSLWIYKSTDKGQNFTATKINTSSITIYSASVSFADENNGIVLSQTYCAYTTNGGTSWIELPSVFSTLGQLVGVWCISSSLVYIIAQSQIQGRFVNTLYISTNFFSGSPTFSLSSSIGQLTQVRFTNSTNGYATSSLTNGLIAKYITNAPTVPTILAQFPGNQCVALVVDTNINEFPINSINVIPYDSNGNALSLQNFTSAPFNITGLTNGQSYTFKIQTVTPAGLSEFSDFSSVSIPNSPLVPQPTFTTALNFYNSNTVSSPIIPRVTIRFIKPFNDGGSAITSYTARIIQQNGTETNITGITTPVSNILLPTNSPITFATIYAVNSVGQATDTFFWRSTSYTSIRSPIISLVSAGAGTYTINISNTYSYGQQSLLQYSIISINASTFFVDTASSPNIYNSINSQPTSVSPAPPSQNITVTGLAAGTYFVYGTLFSGGTAVSNILTITVT